MTRLPGEVDVAVVGAGAAGGAAARTATRAGLTTVLLEAKRRIGGRAWTREVRPGLPVDLGAHWLHSADRNPLARFGRRAGFALEEAVPERAIFFPDAGRWADAAERQERLAFFRHCEALIAAAAAAGRDVPIAEILPDHPRWRPLFEHWVAVYTAVDPGQASAADYANYRDTHANGLVREGYGALVARYGADLPVALATPVSAIDWGGRRIRLATPAGTVEAAAVVLTVSTGVLAAEAIRFDPPLPEWKRQAIEAVPMGRADWVILAFDRNVFGTAGDVSALLWAPTARTMGFQIRPHGRDVALGFLGGSLCGELERAGPAAMVDFALERLKAMFGGGIGRHLAASLTSAWASDPHVRGGYSAARPGRAHLRGALAAPVEDRLFFAGEATDPTFFTTVHGAYRSGMRAARQVVQAVRR